MKCPSCEMISKSKLNCQHCNMDLVLYKKVHMMAARLYNKGLEQARGRCLSGATDTLTMCIRLQKDHIDARNLLGLIYLEVGEIGQAINHWVISLSYQKEENLAKTYLKTVQSDPSQLARYSDTMTLYNKSLQYMSQASEDMAIISLRKALSQNPNYIEAKALLSLYYITEKEEDKAAELLKEILATNKDHSKANHYWNSLNPAAKLSRAKIPQAPAQKTARVQAIGRKMPNTIIEPKSIKGTIIAFALGAVCMLAVYMILITPSKTADLKNEIKVAQAKELENSNQLEALIQEKEMTIKALQEKEDDLERENQSLKEEQEAQQQVLNLQAAKQLSLDRQWVEAVSKLSNINQEYLGEDGKAQYDDLIASVYPKAGGDLYNEGYKAYQAKDYPKALELLEKAYIYAKEEWFSSNTLYTMGRAYEDQGDTQRANQYYQSTIDNYPGTKSANNAKRRIK